MANKTKKEKTESGDDPMMTYPYQLQKLRRETYDTFTLELRPAKDPAFKSFNAGQFNMLYVFGLGEVPISISGNPSDSDNLIHTVRAVGPVTKAMEKLKKGNMLGVRGPYGNNWPVEEAKGKDVIIVAGGIGLAPIRPSIYQILANREKYGKISLLYGARTPEDLLYTRELEKWRARLDIEVFVTVDRAMGEWRGNVGVVTTLIPKATIDPANCIAMICGPEIMMRFTGLEFHKRGIPGENVYVSMERNMKCGIGNCGHCQLGGIFVCKDGPVFRYNDVRETFTRREA